MNGRALTRGIAATEVFWLVCCPALEMSTKPALMVSTCGGEKAPPGGPGGVLVFEVPG